MADEPIDLDAERRRREPPSEIVSALETIQSIRNGERVSRTDATDASAFARGYSSGTSITEQRFRIAILDAGIDLTTADKILSRYRALSNSEGNS